jgi:4-hydroxy-3-polyprenylbenzoate decarboxylase
MPFDSLRDFIDHLERRARLARVAAPVAAALEITEIQTRLLAEGGPAVLFENVTGADGGRFAMPVAANLFGTVERVAWGMGREPHELRKLGEMLAWLDHPEPPENMREAFALLPMLKTALARKPKTVSGAACQEIVLKGADIDLAKLPIQTCWPGEPAPLISFPLVATRGPDINGKPGGDNVGIYRMQVTGKNTALMRWLHTRGGALHYAAWKAKHGADGPPMPAAVTIGADPAVLLAAVTPVPEGLSEYEFAGLLRGKRVKLADCLTVPLKVPASAEIVLEGHVSLSETGAEGPYGDHTGYYNAVDRFPVFTVSAMTMRRDPVYLSTFTGRPPDEPSVLGLALNDVFLPMFARQFPEVVDFYLPPEACSYRIAVVSIRKQYPGHAKRAMMAVWSYLRQFLYTKMVIVVDEDINARDWKDVMWALATRFDPSRDVTIIDNTPIDYLDFASPEPELGGKIGLDATNKIGSETSREWGKPIRMSDDIIDAVTQKWPGLGLPGSGKPIWKK